MCPAPCWAPWGTQKKWKTQSVPAVLLSRSGRVTWKGHDRSVYPTSREWLGIPSLRVSGSPDSHPLPAPPSLGDLEGHGWGKEGGARRLLKGLHCLRPCVTDPVRGPWGGSHGALLTFHCLWEPPRAEETVGTDVIAGLGLSSLPGFR